MASEICCSVLVSRCSRCWFYQTQSNFILFPTWLIGSATNKQYRTEKESENGCRNSLASTVCKPDHERDLQPWLIYSPLVAWFGMPDAFFHATSMGKAWRKCIWKRRYANIICLEVRIWLISRHNLVLHKYCQRRKGLFMHHVALPI